MWLGQSEPTDWTREQEWNRWYSRAHQPEDLAAAPGMVAYERLLNLTPSVNENAPGCKYAVLYEFRTSSILRSLGRMMEIDGETVQAGRHFDAHRASGGGFIGRAVPAVASPTVGGLVRRLEHSNADLERSVRLTRPDRDPTYTAERSQYLPPLLPRGWYVSLLTAPAADTAGVQRWLAGALPALEELSGVRRIHRCVSIQRDAPYIGAIFVGITGENLRRISTSILETEILIAAELGRPDGLRQVGITFQTIDAAGLEPLREMKYPTDPNLFPYIIDDSIGRFMSSIELSP